MLIKKEFRKIKEKNCYTSNLYTLLNPKGNDYKKGVGHVMTYPRSYSDQPLGHEVTPKNTVIKNTILNNVNRTDKEDAKNSGDIIGEKSTEDKEDINDIRRKIKESLNEKGGMQLKSKANLKERNLNDIIKNEYSTIDKSISRRKELLAREIAEELNDNHSLGAFRTVAYKIPEQKIRIFLSIIKDTYLTGKIKKNKGAMFISLAKNYATKNNINLDFK